MSVNMKTTIFFGESKGQTDFLKK